MTLVAHKFLSFLQLEFKPTADLVENTGDGNRSETDVVKWLPDLCVCSTDNQFDAESLATYEDTELFLLCYFTVTCEGQTAFGRSIPPGR
jgi:hypothetical protein